MDVERSGGGTVPNSCGGRWDGAGQREREEEACLATVASLVLAWRSATLFGEDRVKRLVLLCLLESFGLRPRLPSIL